MYFSHIAFFTGALMVRLMYFVTITVSGRQIAFTRIVSKFLTIRSRMLSFWTTTVSTSFSVKVSQSVLSLVITNVSHLDCSTLAPLRIAWVKCHSAEQLPRARLAIRIINRTVRGCGNFFKFI